jgi:hypothetical protein
MNFIFFDIFLRTVGFFIKTVWTTVNGKNGKTKKRKNSNFMRIFAN